VQGAFGTPRGLSYTLYYATTFVFTGLAVAVASHGGLFNIGGEGQAIMGGLGTGLVALWWSSFLPTWIMLPVMLLSGALFGMAWAAVPAYLQAYRGSHVVITTIMFNFIASSVLVYLLVNHLRPSGTMSVESLPFAASAKLPGMHEAMAWFGVEWPASPLNLSFFLALLASVGVYLFLWRTRAGYHVRAVGSSPSAAEYAGIKSRHQVVISMCISGALAGLVGMNEIAGVNGRLLLEFVSGAGFTGIAVALMGRNHPVGIILASILFGALFQGGAEVAFEVRGFSRDMVVMLQGFIVLFSGAMAYVIAPMLGWVLAHLMPPTAAGKEVRHG
jgi:simple sugar transport system permease protein